MTDTMSSRTPFTPFPTTVKVTGATTSARTAITPAPQQRLFNAGAVTAFVRFGVVTTDAVLASAMPIAAGASLIVTPDPAATHIAAITASGTADVYATPGRGV